jgi:transposase
MESVTTTKRKRRKYSPQFKESAVEMVVSQGKSVAQVARELTIHETTLGNWVRDRAGGDTTLVPLVTNERDELESLRIEKQEWLRERDLLKRSVAFWVKELHR